MKTTPGSIFYIDSLTPEEIKALLNEDKILLIMFDEKKEKRLDVIQEALGLSDPSMAKISYHEKGKPYFPNLPYHLSVSTLKNITFLAISKKEIGIDAETQRKIHQGSIIHRFFSPEEQRYLEGNPSLADFLSVWTAKESYVKYTGTGIDPSFSSSSIFTVPQVIMTFTVLDQYTVSVCSDSQKEIVVFLSRRLF